jgi:hypothetical protein
MSSKTKASSVAVFVLATFALLAVVHSAAITGSSVGHVDGTEKRTVAAISRQGSVGVDVTVDPVAIGNAIADAVKTAKNREAVIKNLLETMKFQTHGAYNILIFNLQQNYEWRQLPTDQVHYQSADFDGITFGIWAFRAGEFVNGGDGGFINWAFYGTFKRDGNRLSFT